MPLSYIGIISTNVLRHPASRRSRWRVNVNNSDLSLLRLMVRGAYDLQMVRTQVGLRLCANFRSKLKEGGTEEEIIPDGEELTEEAQKIIDQLKDSYKRLTDGVARNRTIPAEAGFTGDALISTYAELVLVDQYIQLEGQEAKQFRQLSGTLEKLPIYNTYLVDQRGIGPALAAVLVTYFDPHKARHVSSFWKYAGLDVGPDGRGRSKRKEHLVERTYVDSNGKDAVKMSVTYNPWLKAKLMGVMGSSFLRAGSPWRKAYDDYKHRIQTDPERLKCTVAAWKKANAAGEDVTKLWPPGRIHKAATRYMVKMFLAEFWAKYRALEGLSVTPTYHEGVMGHRHGGAAVAA